MKWQVSHSTEHLNAAAEGVLFLLNVKLYVQCVLLSDMPDHLSGLDKPDAL